MGFMNRKLWFLLFGLILVGCTQVRTPPAQHQAPPYRDLNTYHQGSWILLAESSSDDWYYDPRSLTLNNDDTISFWSYWTPNSVTRSKSLAQTTIQTKKPSNNLEDSQTDHSGLDSYAVGPYLQKINCFNNTQLSESLITGKCDIGNNGGGSFIASPGASECWNPIKPKSAMAYIRTRVCGRSFVMEKDVHYFLFQSGRLASPIATNNHNSDTAEASSSNTDAAIFYEVINNEYVVKDPKNDVREMKLAAYRLNKNATHESNYIYRANCQNNTASLSKDGVGAAMQPIGEANSLSGVAFNRLCGNHGQYMHPVKSFSN